MNKRPYQFVGEKIKTELLAGHYKIGERLPPERNIAEQLNVSRTVVRDAMIMLELEGLVEVKKGSGIYVINKPDNLSASYNSQNKLNNEFKEIGPFEMLQARQIIESNIAEFAASQITKYDLIRMSEALEIEQQSLNNGTQNDEGDKEFHLAIAEATKNTALVDTVKLNWEQRESSLMWKTLHSHITDEDYREKWLEEHKTIFAALKKKDPIEAKNAMWQHLESVKQTLLEIADADDPNFDGHLFS